MWAGFDDVIEYVFPNVATVINDVISSSTSMMDEIRCVEEFRFKAKSGKCLLRR